MKKPESADLVRQGKQSDAPFRFLGDALALDALNTERLVKGAYQDLLISPAALLHWWSQAQLHYPILELDQGQQEVLPVDQEMLDAFKVLRTALHQLFEERMAEGDIQEEQLSPLNDILKLGSQVLEQTSPGSFRLRDQPGNEPRARVLLPIVRSAIWLLAEGARGRLRRCRNPRCHLFFYDHTRSATRQWCCLQCMDRARSARRYEQAREQEQRT